MPQLPFFSGVQDVIPDGDAVPLVICSNRERFLDIISAVHEIGEREDRFDFEIDFLVAWEYYGDPLNHPCLVPYVEAEIAKARADERAKVLASLAGGGECCDCCNETECECMPISANNFRVEDGELQVLDCAGGWTPILNINLNLGGSPPVAIDGGAADDFACNKAAGLISTVFGFVIGVLDDLLPTVPDSPKAIVDRMRQLYPQYSLEWDYALQMAFIIEGNAQAIYDELTVGDWEETWRCKLAPLLNNDSGFTQSEREIASNSAYDPSLSADAVSLMRNAWLAISLNELQWIANVTHDEIADCSCASGGEGYSTPTVNGWYLSPVLDNRDHVVPVANAWDHLTTIIEAQPFAVYGAVYTIISGGGSQNKWMAASHSGYGGASFFVDSNDFGALSSPYAYSAHANVFAELFPTQSGTQLTGNVAWSDNPASPRIAANTEFGWGSQIGWNLTGHIYVSNLRLIHNINEP